MKPVTEMMTPVGEMTDEDLSSEYSAAHYYEDMSDDDETRQKAGARMREIRAEWDRRDAVRKEPPQ